MLVPDSVSGEVSDQTVPVKVTDLCFFQQDEHKNLSVASREDSLISLAGLGDRLGCQQCSNAGLGLQSWVAGVMFRCSSGSESSLGFGEEKYQSPGYRSSSGPAAALTRTNTQLLSFLMSAGLWTAPCRKPKNPKNRSICFQCLCVSSSKILMHHLDVCGSDGS